MTAAFSRLGDFRRLVEITRTIFTLGINLFTKWKTQINTAKRNLSNYAVLLINFPNVQLSHRS